MKYSNCLRGYEKQKASGPNSFPTDILHFLAENICKSLSLSNQEFTLYMLKIAKAIPLCKKDYKLIVSKYRPIPLLSTINKILEKFMIKRVCEFLENHKWNIQTS